MLCSYGICLSVVFTLDNIPEKLLVLPRDAIRKRSLCCRPVSVRQSVRLLRCFSQIA